MKTNRPVSVSIIVILSFIGILVTPLFFALNFFYDVFSFNFSNQELIVSVISLIIYSYLLIQIWKMKKIGLELYTLVFFINIAIIYLLNSTIAVNFLNVLLLVVLWFSYKKMTRPSLFDRRT